MVVWHHLFGQQSPLVEKRSSHTSLFALGQEGRFSEEHLQSRNYPCAYLGRGNYIVYLTAKCRFVGRSILLAPLALKHLAACAEVCRTDAVVPNSSSTSFFPKLNGRTSATSGIIGFDLPTEVMQEIACRAGATTTYFWGSADDTSSTYLKNASYNVGYYAPNAWGLYDMVGNMWNGVRDDGSLGNLANAKDAFTPAYDSSETNWRVKGASRGGSYTSATRRASHRQVYPNSGNSSYVGFRVAIVME